MCTVKTPKPPAASTNPASQKPPVYMRNSYLDGLGINAENAGRNSLRIDLGGVAPTPTARAVPAPPFVPLIGNTGLGIGTGGYNGAASLGGPRLGIRLA